MYRFLLRPKWLGFHLLCAGAMVGMISLGFWQLRRLDERASFNDRVAANSDAPVAALDDVLGLPNDEAEYRRVEATGEYLERGFTVVNVSQQGQTGTDAVATLRLDDGTLLIVNRGFVPAGAAAPPPPSGTVTVVGRLKRGQIARGAQPTDDGSQELTEIRRVDLGALAQQFDDPLAPMYVELLGSDPADSEVLAPIAFPSLDDGPHLSYAIQWFAFTACVAVGWVLAVRKSARERAGLPPRRRSTRPPPILED